MGKIYTVAEVNSHIKMMFRQDTMLKSISVKGEVSNCTYHAKTQHIFFTLKDRSGVISCVMYKDDRCGLAFKLEQGMQIVATGRVSVYEKDGKYQLVAQEITKQGIGEIHAELEALKRRLAEEGLFSPEHKREIPKYCKTVGVVTAGNKDAVQDIIYNVGRRNPYVQIIVCPATVQGVTAPQSIVKAIRALEKVGVDTMIVGRGGGSVEDLWAFNDEAVVRAVFDCEVPVISAVGHEKDSTLTDYAADKRVSTPTAAAECAVCEIREVLERMQAARETLWRGMERKLREASLQLENRETRLRYLSPLSQIREKRNVWTRLEESFRAAMERELLKGKSHRIWLEESLRKEMNQKLDIKKRALSIYIERMRGLSPLDKLRQGYSYVSAPDGATLSSVDQVNAGDRLRIYVSDGCVEADAVGKEKIKR